MISVNEERTGFLSVFMSRLPPTLPRECMKDWDWDDQLVLTSDLVPALFTPINEKTAVTLLVKFSLKRLIQSCKKNNLNTVTHTQKCTLQCYQFHLKTVYCCYRCG